MSALEAVQVVALLATGLKAGTLFGDRMGVHFARPELSPSSFVKFQQVQLLRFERFMPALTGIAILSSIAWLYFIRSRIGTLSFILVALAALAHISSLILAVTRCLPINKQLMTWNVSSPPPDIRKIWARWEQVNAVRTLLAVIGFVCLVLALVTSDMAAS